MAKIRQVHFRYGGKLYSSHVEYRTAKRYEKAFFFIRIAEFFVKLLDDVKWDKVSTKIRIHGQTYPVITGDTEGDAEKNWEEFMKEFMDLKKKDTKMILYKFSGRKERSDHRSKYDSDMIKVEFDYEIVVKREFADVVQYLQFDRLQEEDEDVVANKDDVKTRIYDRGDDDWEQGSWVGIPYTEAAHEFMKQIEKAMQDLLTKFNKHMGTNKKMLETIKNSVKLLN